MTTPNAPPLNSATPEEKMRFWDKSEGLREAALAGDHRKLFVWFQEFVEQAEGHLRADRDRLARENAELRAELRGAEGGTISKLKATVTGLLEEIASLKEKRAPSKRRPLPRGKRK